MSRSDISDKWRKAKEVVRRYGDWAHLVPDTLLLAADLGNHNGPSQQGFVTYHEVNDAIIGLVHQPLLSALQEAEIAAALVRCPHCQLRQPLRVVSHNRSGSTAEGLTDSVMGMEGTSDADIMFEFDGQFSWVSETELASRPVCISPQLAPQLMVSQTCPGFVNLYWVPTTLCSHKESLVALAAQFFRQTMERLARVMRRGEITTAGPAVNSRETSDMHGGVDHVPCLLVRGMWPEVDQFLGRSRRADFPSAAARSEICRFGIHLVPVGQPGGCYEPIEHRVSYSRAEVVAALHLNAVQHATITTLKAIKKLVSDRDVANTEGLKSYFIKTAVLWLAQDRPSGSWTSITAGVRWALDWLEDRLIEGYMPCFFWFDVDVTLTLRPDQRQAAIGIVREVREHLICYLVACCERQWPGILDFLLERGAAPLSERELRRRLGRWLVRGAVIHGTRFRPSAPCWSWWWKGTMSTLARVSEHGLLLWYHRKWSGANDQQRLLLQAWVVADPADVAVAPLVTSRQGELITLDAAPLMALLTEEDLRRLLYDPAAVAAWCRRQLRLPLAERPPGLTAELDTLRGRAELLLQPELLMRALREAVPERESAMRIIDQHMKELWESNFTATPSYQWCREKLQFQHSCDLEAELRRKLPADDELPIASTARHWRRNLQHALSGDRLLQAYRAASTRWPDWWELKQYVLRSVTEDEQQQQPPPQPQTQPQSQAQLLPQPQRTDMARRHRQQHLQLKQRHAHELSALKRQRLQEWAEATRQLGQWQAGALAMARRQRLQEDQLKEQHAQELDAQRRRQLQEWEDQERHLRRPPDNN